MLVMISPSSHVQDSGPTVPMGNCFCGDEWAAVGKGWQENVHSTDRKFNLETKV